MGPRFLLPLATTAVLTLLAAGTTLHVVRAERSARVAAITQLEADAHVIETAIDRQLTQTETLLASIPLLLDRLSEAGLRVTPKVAFDILGGLSLQNLAVDDIALIQPDGAVWTSRFRSAAGEPEDVDPRVFTESRVTNHARLVGPIRTAAGEASIYLVRQISVPGHGAMTAVAQIRVSGLLNQIAELKQTVSSRIMVQKPTGEIVATLPRHDELVGTVIERAGSTRMAGGAGARDEAGEVFTVVRHSLSGDLLVVLASEAEVALAEWRGERDRSVAIAISAAALVLVMAAALSIVMRRGERIAEERARITTILECAVEGMADGFALWDASDRLVACNDVYRDLYSLIRHVLVPGTPFDEIVRWGAEIGQFPEALGRVDDYVDHAVTRHRTGLGAFERRLPDGRWVLVRERLMADGGLVAIHTDITAIKKAQAELAKATERANIAVHDANRQNLALHRREREIQVQSGLFEAALNNMSHGLLMVDREDRVTVANPRLAELFGIGGTVLEAGSAVADLLDSARQAGAMDVKAIDEMSSEQSRLARERAWGAFVCQGAEGRILAVTQRPLQDGGWVAIYEDVTVQRRAEQRIAFLAHHDELTKLPNRARFRSELDSRLAQLAEQGRPFALVSIDLDGFKGVNDTYGHQAGDALLQEIADRLRDQMGPGDVAVRLGGDEFAVIREGGGDGDDLNLFGQTLVGALSRPLDTLGKPLVVGASVGIAEAWPGMDRESVIRNADLALYQAKSLGRGTWRIFDPLLEQSRARRNALEQALREALDRHEFFIVYQPIFDLRLGRVVGFEALLRWNHPEQGAISPAEFIPIAEEIGLASRIGAFVLATACRDIALMPGEVRIAVNVSTQQLRSEAVVQSVVEALRGSALAPGRLELEITETALLADNSRGAQILERLSALGARIALDDFGTGYSSLSHLRNFPLDKIKIDRSFVREITSNSESAAIVTSLIDLAGKLGMTTTAEGVETPEQLHALREAGCEEAQGFLLGRPRSILHAIEVMADRAHPSMPHRGSLPRFGARA